MGGYAPGSQPLYGRIDEVRILAKALDDDEIQSDYNLMPGDHTVTVYAEKAGATTDETVAFKIASEELTADFKADETTGPAPLTVNFRDKSQGDPTDWLWDFGDDEGSINQNPTHAYQEPGTYTVFLGVWSALGADDEIKTDYINVTMKTCQEFDLNEDEEVDMGDLFAVTKSGYWGCYPNCEAGYEDFDLNGDEAVDMGDLFAVTKSGYWGTECT